MQNPLRKILHNVTHSFVILKTKQKTFFTPRDQKKSWEKFLLGGILQKFISEQVSGLTFHNCPFVLPEKPFALRPTQVDSQEWHCHQLGKLSVVLTFSAMIYLILNLKWPTF